MSYAHMKLLAYAKKVKLDKLLITMNLLMEVEL